jgi:hypothetical protein
MFISRTISLLPRRVPQVLVGIAQRVAAGMPQIGKGIGIFLLPIPNKTEERRKYAAKGSLSFGYFSLAAQRKVSRPRVREPNPNAITPSPFYCNTTAMTERGKNTESRAKLNGRSISG